MSVINPFSQSQYSQTETESEEYSRKYDRYLENLNHFHAPADLILVIDMQNVYRPDEPWGCVSFHRSCANIRALLDTLALRYAPPSVCFTRFISDPQGKGTWAQCHTIHPEIHENPWLCAIVDELAPYTRRYPLYSKSVYSSMGIPEVRGCARRAGRIVLTGVVSECCVLATCMDAVDMGCQVIYLQDACSGLNPAAERAVLRILAELNPLHVSLVNTADYLRALNATAGGI